MLRQYTKPDDIVNFEKMLAFSLTQQSFSAAKNFQEIIKYTKNQDKDGLSKLISANICINMHQNNQTPVEIFSANNDIVSAMFLIDFAANINSALFGAAKKK